MNKEKMFEEIEAYFQHINYAYNIGVAYFALRDDMKQWECLIQVHTKGFKRP